MKLVCESIEDVLKPKSKSLIMDHIRKETGYSSEELNSLLGNVNINSDIDYIKPMYIDLLEKLKLHPTLKKEFINEIHEFIPVRLKAEAGWGNAYKLYYEYTPEDRIRFKNIMFDFLRFVKEERKNKI